MKFILFLFFFLLPTDLVSQSIDVIDVQQEGTSLKILYDFSGAGSSEIILYYSFDNGNSWLGPAKSVTGEIGKGIRPGKGKICIWNVLADRDSLKTATLKVKIKALTGTVCKDINDNVYETIKIGNQVWMKENLRVFKYRNGDIITQSTKDEEWRNAEMGACCKFRNDSILESKYGLLYNWYVIADPRGLCPAGFHIPSQEEFIKLEKKLGGNGSAGGKLKSKDALWNSPNDGATNESNFSALPSGFRNSDGIFSDLGDSGFLWTSSNIAGSPLSSYLALYSYSSESYLKNTFQGSGFSVRCLKD